MALTVVQRLSRIRLQAYEPQALAPFYVEALGFEVEAQSRGRFMLTLGASQLEIALANGRAYPGNVPGWSPLFQHFAIAVADMSLAMARVGASAGWTSITRGAPQRLPAESGGVTAFKFRDPEGHPLELIQFPNVDDGAAPRIDHSALSVADTSRSIAFYETLGLAVTSRFFNKGLEQDRLDGVASADVEVTGLAPPRAGPHVELLGYRGDFPRSDPPAGLDDVAATRMVFSTAADLGAVRASLGAFVVPSGPTIPVAALLLRDPDGHLLQIESPT